jgi:hypothetical protein
MQFHLQEKNYFMLKTWNNFDVIYLICMVNFYNGWCCVFSKHSEPDTCEAGGLASLTTAEKTIQQVRFFPR